MFALTICIVSAYRSFSNIYQLQIQLLSDSFVCKENHILELCPLIHLSEFDLYIIQYYV